MTTAITTELVKQLRDATGVSVMQCRKALEEAEGDMDKALMILKKKSSDIAAKKSERNANDGVVVIKQSGNKTAMVVVNCETDFVAKNEDFTTLANAIADKVLAEGKDAVVASASDLINPVIQKTGENIQLGPISVFEGNTIGSYVHNGKSGVVVELSGGTSELARDVAMHIAAMKPEYIKREDVSADMINKARELFAKEVEETGAGKPEDIKKKMLEGKIDAYFKEQTLADQSYIKNSDMTVGALLAQGGATVTRFERYTL